VWGGLTFKKEECLDNVWKLSIPTLVMFSWALVAVVIYVVWGLAAAAVENKYDWALTRDKALVVVLWPWVLWIALTSEAQGAMDAAVKGNPSTAARPRFRDFFNPSYDGMSATIAGVASSLVLTATLGIVLSAPSFPGVEACVINQGVQKCNVPAFGTVLVGSEWYYMNATTIYTMSEAEGSRAARFYSADLQAVMACNGQRPSQLPASYKEAGAWPVTTSATGYTASELCFGAGVGIAAGEFVSAVITAVTTYCPGQPIQVNLQGDPATVFVDWSNTQAQTQWDANYNYMLQVCRLTTGECTDFPQVGNSYGSLFIRMDGTVSAIATGAIAEVNPPTIQGQTGTAGACDQTECWAWGVGPQNCPWIEQSLQLTALQVVTADIEFDPMLPAPEINPEWNAEEIYTPAASLCISPPIGDAYAGYITLKNGVQTVDQNHQCYQGGKLNLPGCKGLVDTQMTGQTSPIPSDNGRTVLFSCASSGTAQAQWVTAGSTPGPQDTPQNCTNLIPRGEAVCAVCGYERICYKAGSMPMPSKGESGGSSQLTNGSYIFPSGSPSNYCDLMVVSSDADSITVNAINSPCVTTGQMGSMVLVWGETVKIHMPVDGVVEQSVLNGTLKWQFYSHYSPAKPTNYSTNTTIIPAGSACSESWDCGFNPACWVAEAAEWRNCQATMEQSDCMKTSVGCRLFEVVFNLLVAVLFTVAALYTALWAVKKLKSRKSSYKQSK